MSSSVQDLSEEEMGKVAGGTALPFVTATVFLVASVLATINKTNNGKE